MEALQEQNALQLTEIEELKKKFEEVTSKSARLTLNQAENTNKLNTHEIKRLYCHKLLIKILF